MMVAWPPVPSDRPWLTAILGVASRWSPMRPLLLTSRGLVKLFPLSDELTTWIELGFHLFAGRNPLGAVSLVLQAIQTLPEYAPPLRSSRSCWVLPVAGSVNEGTLSSTVRVGLKTGSWMYWRTIVSGSITAGAPPLKS